MDFQETDEQAMIRQMVRDFAEEVLAPTAALRDKEQRPPLAEWESPRAMVWLRTSERVTMSLSGRTMNNEL